MNDEHGTPHNAVIAWLMVLCALGLLGFAVSEWSRKKTEVPPQRPSGRSGAGDEYLRNAEVLFKNGNYAEARKVARTAAEIDPALTAAAILAGDASIKLGDLEGAVEYFSRVPRTSRLSSVDATFGLARAHFYLGSYKGAETALRDVLERRPTHTGANDLLAEILDVEGRRWESVPFAVELARQGEASLEAMLLLADDEYVIRPNDRAQRVLERDSGNLIPKLGLARAEFDNGRRENGLTLLSDVLKHAPYLVEAQVLWGDELLNSDPTAFAEWHANLPPSAEAHPHLWLLRGTWAREAKEMESAARCFWEALRRNPNNRAAHFHLARSLTLLTREADAKPFLDRGLQLARLKKVLEPVIAAGDESSSEELTDVAVILESLGRRVEALNWERAAKDQQDSRFEPLRPPATSTAETIAVWVDAEANPAIAIDLSDYPVPNIQTPKASATGLRSDMFAAKFEDLAPQAGLVFSFIPAPDESTDGKRVIELTGGGAAAFDFDLDNRPDLFFPQGGYIPAKADAAPTDRLFRNIGTRFVDVSELTGMTGTDFGQGVATGDFNSDGFPDLFVGNLGKNRLYSNNGDGTFTDVTTVLNSDRSDWTTSAAMADLNGDALPDLYVTNYLAGDEINHRICRLNDSVPPRICPPDQFEAAQDRVFLNLGDGRFEDRTESSGIVIPNGKGLGLLAADFFAGGSIQLFVANDGVANFFFSIDESQFVFTDTATTNGIAMNGDGLAQACMGVAAGDANADGQLDLFVTNFDRESNTLYLGNHGLFEDASRSARLRHASWRMLGFGTQFVDGDLDGNADLIVTNGHVDDFSHQGTAYRMRPQYFRNMGTGAFIEQASPGIGSFFSREQLGRSLCRLDWNRDGRADAAVSHLDTPASLVTNVSSSTGRFLSVKLIGTRTNRDAVGTIVTIVDGDWRRTQQQVAGDGYLCANERLLTFGLGMRTTVPKLDVRWLDGSTETFENIDADQEIVVVQGRGDYLVNVD